MKPVYQLPTALLGGSLLFFATALLLTIPVLFLPGGILAAAAAVTWVLRNPR